jgi:hypothetical protein
MKASGSVFCKVSLTLMFLQFSQALCLPVLNSPWAKDGERFQSYSFFRDELVFKMLEAKQRVAVVSPLLADADVATALFAQKIKGLSTLAILDVAKSRSYHSRHEYLARAQVPTHLVNFDGFLKKLKPTLPQGSAQFSYVVLDNEAWAINTWFEETLGIAKESQISPGKDLGTGNSSRDVFVEPSRYTADEIWNWQFNKGQSVVNPAQRKLPRTLTTTGIVDKLTNIPRKLPKETRLQKISKNQSAGTEASTGSTIIPAPPANESDVVE